ncbi:MAG: hypothetical protein Q7K43_00975, partial [Candidatus Woesearchaeota archaeon]|nr:hypothetical protein [Candidatus Woesearchaeota archaeon]
MLQNSTTEKVLEVIFAQPMRKFTVRELARCVKISPPTVLRIVVTLKKEGIVRDLPVATASQISANLESSSYYRYKLLANLHSLLVSGLVEHIVKVYHDPKAIILF